MSADVIFNIFGMKLYFFVVKRNVFIHMSKTKRTKKK